MHKWPGPIKQWPEFRNRFEVPEQTYSQRPNSAILLNDSSEFVDNEFIYSSKKKNYNSQGNLQAPVRYFLQKLRSQVKMPNRQISRLLCSGIDRNSPGVAEEKKMNGMNEPFDSLNPKKCHACPCFHPEDRNAELSSR